MNELHAIIRDAVYVRTQSNQSIQKFRPDLSWVMDFKTVSLHTDFLQAYSAQFEKLILSRYPDIVQVAGMESGALPLLAALRLVHSEKVVNAFYVRKSRKKGDLTKKVEGDCLPGIPIILVDDVLNSGATLVKQIAIISELGFSVSEIFSIVRFKDAEYYRDVFGPDIRVTSIFELNDFADDLGLHNLESDSQPKSAIFSVYNPTWKVTLGLPNHYDVIPKSAPIADRQHIYLGSDEGFIFAVDKSSGDKIWEFKTHFTSGRKGIYSSPALYNDSLYCGAYDGNIYCLDTATGAVRWISFEGDYVGSSPCVAPDLDLVFIGLEFGLFRKKGGVVALQAQTGKVVWVDRQISGFVHASPVYSKKYNLVVCGSNNGVLYAFDAKTGARRWEFATTGDIKYKAVFDEHNEYVVVGSLDGGVYVLDAKTGLLIHRFAALAGFYSTPVIYNNTVIIGSLDRTIYCFSLETKKTVWSVETQGRIFSSAVVDSGCVYIGSNDGGVYVLDAKTGIRAAHIQLTERIVNSVVVEGDTLYIGTHAAELYRYDKKMDTHETI